MDNEVINRTQKAISEIRLYLTTFECCLKSLFALFTSCNGTSQSFTASALCKFIMYNVGPHFQ